LHTRVHLQDTLIAARSAPCPAGIDEVWKAIASRANGAEAHLRDAGMALGSALLDEQTTRRLTDLLDRSPIGTQVDVVIVPDVAASALPYELLRLADGRLLATIPGARMRRRLGDATRQATPPLAGPLKILVAVGAPEETLTASAPLDIEAEMQAILDAVAEVEARSEAQIKILEVGGLLQIERALRDDQHHVLHLSAHGSPDGVELEDEDGNPVPVT
ncbi:unnamed protein product, partial [Phaeothamnion confervicola]